MTTETVTATPSTATDTSERGLLIGMLLMVSLGTLAMFLVG